MGRKLTLNVDGAEFTKVPEIAKAYEYKTAFNALKTLYR